MQKINVFIYWIGSRKNLLLWASYSSFEVIDCFNSLPGLKPFAKKSGFFKQAIWSQKFSNSSFHFLDWIGSEILWFLCKLFELWVLKYFNLFYILHLFAKIWVFFLQAIRAMNHSKLFYRQNQFDKIDKIDKNHILNQAMRASRKSK